MLARGFCELANTRKRRIVMSTADFVSPEGRLSFPALFEAKAPVPGADPKFSATVLIPKDGAGVAEFMQKVQAGIMAKVAEKWPNEATRPKQLRIAIKDGDLVKFESGEMAGTLKKDKYPEMAGCWVIPASSKNKPGVVDAAGNPILVADQVKAGYWVRISFNVFAYSNVNVGVSCGLQNVMLVRTDDPFGQASRAEDDFSAFFNQTGGEAPAAGEVQSAGGVDSMFA